MNQQIDYPISVNLQKQTHDSNLRKTQKDHVGKTINPSQNANK
jgi:hypothetical protein